MSDLRTVRLPDGAFLCWCTAIWFTLREVDMCDHHAARPTPYVPGPDLRTAVGGTTYVSRTAPLQRSRLAAWRLVNPWWWLVLGVLLCTVAVELLILFAPAQGFTNPDHRPVTTPTTYGPPGPSGGPVIRR